MHKNKLIKKLLVMLFFLMVNLVYTDVSTIYLNTILGSTENAIDKNYKRLSSGTLLLTDDPANYAIYEKLSAVIKELEKVISNNADMFFYYKSADGYLTSTIDILQRIRELSLKKINPILSDFDIGIIHSEINQLYEQILFSLKNADFNKKTIFGPLLGEEELKNWFQKKKYYQLDNIDNLLSFFVKQRSLYGVKIRSLEYQNQGMSIERENTANFRSNIHDINYGTELSQLRKNHLILTINLLMLSEDY